MYNKITKIALIAIVAILSFSSCKKTAITIGGPVYQPTPVIPGVTVPKIYRVFIESDPGPLANYTQIVPVFADSTNGVNPVNFFTTVDCARMMPTIREHFRAQIGMQPQRVFYFNAVQDKSAGGALLNTYTGSK